MPVNRPRYTTGEEIANSVTHGVGALMSLVGLILLSVYAGMGGDAWQQTTVAILGLNPLLRLAQPALSPYRLASPRSRRQRAASRRRFFLRAAALLRRNASRSKRSGARF
jgi:hemolysin III